MMFNDPKKRLPEFNKLQPGKIAVLSDTVVCFDGKKVFKAKLAKWTKDASVFNRKKGEVDWLKAKNTGSTGDVIWWIEEHHFAEWLRIKVTL